MKKSTFICLLVAVSMLVLPAICTAQTINKPLEGRTEELYQDIFLTLLLPHIDKEISNYYSALLTYKPTVYPYQIEVIQAKRTTGDRSFSFLITLQVGPVIGPHISVGIDQLTFYIAPGRVILKDFKHIKTFDLPPHYQQYLKEN